NIAVTLASAFLATALLISGLMTRPTLQISIAAVVPALVGVQLGSRARRHIPTAMFRTLVLVLLILFGVIFVARYERADGGCLVPIQKFLPGFFMNLEGTLAEPFNFIDWTPMLEGLLPSGLAARLTSLRAQHQLPGPGAPVHVRGARRRHG